MLNLRRQYKMISCCGDVVRWLSSAALVCIHNMPLLYLLSNALHYCHLIHLNNTIRVSFQTVYKCFGGNIIGLVVFIPRTIFPCQCPWLYCCDAVCCVVKHPTNGCYRLPIRDNNTGNFIIPVHITIF